MCRRSRERGGRETEASRPTRLSPHPLTLCCHNSGPPEGSERGEGGWRGSYRGHATYQAVIRLNRPPTQPPNAIVFTAHTSAFCHAYATPPIMPPMSSAQPTVAPSEQATEALCLPGHQRTQPPQGHHLQCVVVTLSCITAAISGGGRRAAEAPTVLGCPQPPPSSIPSSRRHQARGCLPINPQRSDLTSPHHRRCHTPTEKGPDRSHHHQAAAAVLSHTKKGVPVPPIAASIRRLPLPAAAGERRGGGGQLRWRKEAKRWATRARV
jgi:hypothetical protein